jgi:lipopolysaccharide biosynthesis glycosyltransferase
MLCSALEHNTNVRIHLFHSYIDKEQLAKLDSFVVGYGGNITHYEMDPVQFQDLRVDRWVSLATYYRVLAPYILPKDLDKILYLDSDLVVRRSLEELWNTDLRDHSLAAVLNENDFKARIAVLGLPAESKYFNAGVLLINLAFWRQYGVSERVLAFIRNHPEKLEYWDQDALNAILADQWIELPGYWNLQDHGWEKDPAIAHFCGPNKKPWHWSSDHHFKFEYHKYRVKTPWPRFKLEGAPGLRLRFDHFLRGFGGSPRNRARTVLPTGLRNWLRSRMASPRT